MPPNSKSQASHLIILTSLFISESLQVPLLVPRFLQRLEEVPIDIAHLPRQGKEIDKQHTPDRAKSERADELSHTRGNSKNPHLQNLESHADTSQEA